MINLKLFCDQLAKELGLEEAIQEETPGLFSLPIAEDVTIQMKSIPEGFTLHAALCNCPQENPEFFLTEVMNANLFGHVTRNCVLGLSEDNRLTLSRAIDYNIDYKGFTELLQDFYNIALFWRDQGINNLKMIK